MDTRKDISTRADIENFLQVFYEKVMTDNTIGIIFTTVVPINLEQHIPVLADFWETILLDNPRYKNNAMEVHYHINRLFPLKKIHFDAWLALFNATIDELYEGPLAMLAKKRAAAIGQLMQHNMNDHKTIL